MVKFIVNNKSLIAQKEIDDILLDINGLKFAEIWIEGHEKGKLCVLMNNTRVFFMYLKSDESSYLIFDENESEDYNEDFLLSNGQIDEYPKNMTVDREVANDIIRCYYLSGKRYDNINWVEG